MPPAPKRRLSSSITTAASLFALAACPAGGGGETGTTTVSDTTTATPTSSTTTATPTTTTTTATTTTPTTGAPPLGDPFSLTILEAAWITGTDGWNTQHRDVAYDLGPAPFKTVKLIVDLESDCYPWDKWQSDPPPAGQSWPASCDAFDRTMGFISDPAADASDPPGFELLRSITPFGGPAHIEADITDYANTHPGEHDLRAYINTWPDGAGQVSGSAGGWHLSVRIEVEPGEAPRNVLAAISLVQGDIGAAGADQTVPFTLPEGVTKAEIEYRVSGHGGAAGTTGCIGPAEEFCRRTHHVTIDDTLNSFDAWRTDCANFCTITDNPLPVGPAKYCLENPCGATQSVMAARANWCPGDLVPPLRGAVTSALLPGPDHKFRFAIDDVVEGGTWTVFAALYAYGP